MKITSESRKEEKQLVVDTLLDQGSNVDLTVLPFFGMGGLGKTTLAQLVYNDPKIQEHFQLLLWLCVSDNFDVNFLEKRIVEEAAQHKKSDSEEAAQHKKRDSEEAAKHKKSDSESLKEVLRGKRYLLVLDDVWNRDTSKWKRLKSSLQHGSMGSCVLTTTRDKAIAELMGTIKAHKLGVLDKNFIEKIIKIKAFGSEQGSATELVNMVGAMADKCAGSPLAATALGSMLHNMPSEMEWKTVLSRSTICDDETGILPIQDDHKVLECLEPHDGIKALRIESYGGNTSPTWMNTLPHMVELVLSDCEKIERLTPLWQLPALQVLCIRNMKNLRCFCDGADRPFTFKKLKELRLYGMENFEAWWDINKMQGQEDPVIFPEIELLSIKWCQRLTALPGARTMVSSDRVVDIVWPSSFPKLKKLNLEGLPVFQRWEAIEGDQGEQVTTFPSLENLIIEKCPKLTTLPEAPKLSVLTIDGGSQQLCLHATRYITRLPRLKLSASEREATLPSDHNLIKLVDHKEKSFVRVLSLSRCDFFLAPVIAPALWSRLVQLEDLTIVDWDALEDWPENVFQCLVSLRKLKIWECKKLTERTQQKVSSEQSSTTRSVLPPQLESLSIYAWESLVEVPTLPASLRSLIIARCHQIESIIVRQEQSTSIRLQEGSSSSFSPSVPLELRIEFCQSLQSLSVQLDDLPSLDLVRLTLYSCASLESIPDVPQAYSSLRYLVIEDCPRLKVLPPCLKQRLNDIEKTYLDDRYTESRPKPKPKLSRPSTWKYAISGHCLAIRGHGDRQHHTGPQEHGSAPVAHGDDTASQNRVQNLAAPAGAQAAAQMMVQPEEANRGSNEQEELMELDFKPDDRLEDLPAPKADAMAPAIPKAELHRSTRQADSVPMEQAEKLKAGCNLDGPYPKVESPQKEPLLAYNVQDEDTQVHSRIEDEDASDQRNEEMLQPRDEEGEAASFEGNGQQRTNAVPKELKEPKNAKKSTNREGMMDRHHEISTRQAEQEVELLAKETEATKSTDYSIKRCISVMNSMDVTVEEKAKAYSFFKNKDNREVFLCACEGDPESALLWLRNEMVKQVLVSLINII